MAAPGAPAPLARLHAAFLSALPRIERHARVCFRHLRCPHTRDDAVAETVALCWLWFVRLVERGQDPLAFVSRVADFAARHVRSGRRLCGQEKGKDALSPLAQRRHGFAVEYLPGSVRAAHDDRHGAVRGQRKQDAWEERLRDNTQTPVPEQVCFRIDFPAWLATLTGRERRLVREMANNERTLDLSARFDVSPARISQLRRELHNDWSRFLGDDAEQRRPPAGPFPRPRTPLPEREKMPSFTWPLRRVGRLLAQHVGRLHAALERLAGEVRAAVARAVGQATGDAVREALGVILDGPPERPGYHDRADDREGGWGQPRRPTWPATRPYDAYARDPYEPDPDDLDDEPPDRCYADQESPADEPVATRRRGRWSRAVAAGCQAAGWWLRRHPGPLALLAAVGVGLAAGVATLVSSPLVAGASAVAASVLGLLALADAAREASGLADRAVK